MDSIKITKHCCGQEQRSILLYNEMAMPQSSSLIIQNKPKSTIYIV